MVEHNVWYHIYHSNGKFSQLYAGVLQVLWDFILLLMVASIYIRNEERASKYALFKILIIGITLYLMLFEARSKYSFMFLPVYVGFAGIIWNDFFWMQDKNVKQRS